MINTNELICGNNIEVLKTYPDNYIDLTVTSPPYDDLRNYHGYSFDFETIARELFRVTKKGGVVVWVVGDSVIKGSESGTSFKQALYFKEIGFNLHDTMIYSKNGLAKPESVRYYQSFEYMFVFSKGKPKSINLIQDKKNKCGGEIHGKFTIRQKDGSTRQRNSIVIREFGVRENVWRYDIGKWKVTKDKIAYNHPAIFSEKLAHDHIISWSNEGDLVLDPFAGSGTTLKMARQLKRNYIGIEINADYINIIKERLMLNKPLA